MYEAIGTLAEQLWRGTGRGIEAILLQDTQKRPQPGRIVRRPIHGGIGYGDGWRRRPRTVKRRRWYVLIGRFWPWGRHSCYQAVFRMAKRVEFGRERAPGREVLRLRLSCTWGNCMAVARDHSLNVSPLPLRGGATLEGSVLSSSGIRQAYETSEGTRMGISLGTTCVWMLEVPWTLIPEAYAPSIGTQTQTASSTKHVQY